MQMWRLLGDELTQWEKTPFNKSLLQSLTTYTNNQLQVKVGGNKALFLCHSLLYSGVVKKVGSFIFRQILDLLPAIH
jgi:hypothetical protein